MKLETLIHQDPLQRTKSQSPNASLHCEKRWPSSLQFTDSPTATRDHGSNLKLHAPSLESFCSSSSVLCTQHPMAGISAVNRNGT